VFASLLTVNKLTMFNKKIQTFKIISITLLLTLGATTMAGIHFINKAKAASATTFDWQASESAPKSYPMKIIAGNFYSPNGDSLYVPNGVKLHHGWGRGRSSHVVGEDLKSLPNRLSISFFSYSENQFYNGEFTLPYEKILALFQTGHYSPKDEDHITYDEITVGVAPGGAVSVWVVSLDRTVEIFFGYADKEEGSWASINDNPNITREKYIRSGIQNALEAEQLSPEAIATIKKSPIPLGLWERYHKNRYNWQPLFTNMPVYGGRIDYIKYYNRERDYIDIPVKENQAESTRAVPSLLDFTWNRPFAKPLRLKLSFNEDEIFSAFEKLGSNNQPLQFEMRMEPEKNYSFTIWLKNKTESLEIKQTKVETYGIPE